jgi:hypothetical protein
MSDLAEMYPVGGAADRLNLIDPVSKEALPAAELVFCGMTLLERLVVDVQVKGVLALHSSLANASSLPTRHDDLHGKRQSYKGSFEYVRKITTFIKARTPSFFRQPFVPTITCEGAWALKGVMQPPLRPGGHGVIWKLARDVGLNLDWLQKRNIKKILVRQINNPIASEDYGLYAFSGSVFRKITR